MTLIYRKRFDWEEDRDNFDFSKWCWENRGHKSYRAITKLSLKGMIRKLFRLRKEKQKNG